MDEKRRSKRTRSFEVEGTTWECSVCTYRNSQEAFKCEMCDVRKGTSTRKPRLNSQLVAAQQVAQQYTPPLKKERRSLGKKNKDSDSELEDGDSDEENDSEAEEDGDREAGEAQEETDLDKHNTSASSSHSESPNNNTKVHRPPRLKNIDRSSGVSMEVTVNNVTVIITDYKPKRERLSTASPCSSPLDNNRTATLTCSPTTDSKNDIKNTKMEIEDNNDNIDATDQKS